MVVRFDPHALRATILGGVWGGGGSCNSSGGPKAFLMQQGISFGRGEAADVGFTALCIGYTFYYKDAPEGQAGGAGKTLKDGFTDQI